MSEKFYGKYRGMVLNNVDPMMQGRLLVQVPDVLNVIPSSWAMPCVPVAGIQNGMIALPIKMVLRWTINLKYIIAMPEIFFNV